MAGSTFIDTNIFVYCVDTAEPDKQKQAQQVVGTTARVVVSTQVMNEFYTITTRKLPDPLSAADAAAAVEALARYTCVSVDAELVLRAIMIGQRWELSHWDALMVAAARQAGCDRLLSEDLAHGARYDMLRIENPFHTPMP